MHMNIYKMSKNIGSTIYDSMARIGNTQVNTTNVVLSIVGVLMLICSVYIFTHPSDNVDGTAMAVNNSVCKQMHKTNSCTTQISYVINGKNLTGSIVDNVPHMKGSTVNISYDPKNPTNVVVRQTPNSIVAIIIAIVGVLLIVAAYAYTK